MTLINVKECAQVLVNVFNTGLSLPRKKNVAEWTDGAGHDPNGLTGLYNLNTNEQKWY